MRDAGKIGQVSGYLKARYSLCNLPIKHRSFEAALLAIAATQIGSQYLLVIGSTETDSYSNPLCNINLIFSCLLRRHIRRHHIPFVPSSADKFQELETLNRQLKVAPSHTGAKDSLFNSPWFTNFIDEWS